MFLLSPPQVCAEIGSGTASVTGPMAMELDGSFAQFCILHYNQDGLVQAARQVQPSLPWPGGI